MSVRSVITAGLLALASAVNPVDAEAAVFRTTIDFAPVSLGTGVPTPVLGNRIIVDWATDRTSGNVGVTDLSELTFTLSGLGTALFVDPVIVGGVFQPFGGVTRDAGVVDFLFSLDLLATDPAAGVLLLSNYTFDLSLTAGTVYEMRFPGFGSVQSSRFVGGVFFPFDSVSGPPIAINTQAVAAIPVPPTILLLFSGLLGLGLAMRGRGGHASAAAAGS